MAYEVGKQSRSQPEAPSRLIVRAVLQLGRRLRAQRPLSSLSLSQLAVLATLHRLGPMPAARLAEQERLQPQSLTRVIADMDSAGLISRQRGASDRRTLVIAITRKGRQKLGQDIRARRFWLEQAMAATLSPAEQVLLRLSADLMLQVAGYESRALDSGDSPTWN